MSVLWLLDALATGLYLSFHNIYHGKFGYFFLIDDKNDFSAIFSFWLAVFGIILLYQGYKAFERDDWTISGSGTNKIEILKVLQKEFNIMKLINRRIEKIIEDDIDDIEVDIEFEKLQKIESQLHTILKDIIPIFEENDDE